MNAFPQINLLVDAPPRPLPNAVGTQAPVTYGLQSATVTYSWGSAPGTATLVYVGEQPVAVGASVSFQLGINWFVGVCRSCVENRSAEGGNTFTLEFQDARLYLAYDIVYGAFNKPDVRLAGGVRLKRYKHLLPANHGNWFWTYTDTPLTGTQILAYLLGAPTVGTPWTYDTSGRGLFPAGVLNGYVMDLDFTGGTRLDAALNALCEKAGGVVYTLNPVRQAGQPYRLEFTRKGFDTITGLPDWLRDSQKDGQALTGNPTNVRVLGDRNKYQLMNVPCEPDWTPAWQAFLVFETFADYIFKNATDLNPNSPYHGTRFNAYPNDPEQYTGRLYATAYAYQITLADFVALMNTLDTSGVTGASYVDNRKFAGRSRMLMPCALYLEKLVFRAFKPNLTAFVNADGKSVPLDSLNLADQLLCRVTHDPGTGVMSYDVTQPVDSNGYAVIQGYNLVPDLLRMVKSDQFDLKWFQNTYGGWGQQTFQIDDSGEGNRFLIFDEPIVVGNSSNPLVLQQGNHVVINAAATLVVPAVAASLVFEGELFSYWQGTYPQLSLDVVENVPGLCAELVGPVGGPYTEIPYNNGQRARQEAAVIATSLLTCQWWYYEGGQRHIWDGVTPLNQWGTQISSLIDRVTYRLHPSEGLVEEIDLTRERRTNRFEPERELDRRTLQNSLFPGQFELRQKSEQYRTAGAVWRSTPEAVKGLFAKFLRGELPVQGPVTITNYKPNSNTGGSAPAGYVPVGSIIRKQPLTTSSSVRVNTVPDFTAVLDSNSLEKRTEFVGVTVAHNTDASKPFAVQTSGIALARVQGPVAMNQLVGLVDPVGSAPTGNYLGAATRFPVAQALEPITSGSTVLIKVKLGLGQVVPKEYHPFKIYQPDPATLASTGWIFDATTGAPTSIAIDATQATSLPTRVNPLTDGWRIWAVRTGMVAVRTPDTLAFQDNASFAPLSNPGLPGADFAFIFETTDGTDGVGAQSAYAAETDLVAAGGAAVKPFVLTNSEAVAIWALWLKVTPVFDASGALPKAILYGKDVTGLGSGVSGIATGAPFPSAKDSSIVPVGILTVSKYNSTLIWSEANQIQYGSIINRFGVTYNFQATDWITGDNALFLQWPMNYRGNWLTDSIQGNAFYPGDVVKVQTQFILGLDGTNATGTNVTLTDFYGYVFENPTLYFQNFYLNTGFGFTSDPTTDPNWVLISGTVLHDQDTPGTTPNT